MNTTPFPDPVLIVGAGVAGMRAALDLADAGTPVLLVEKEGHLGGQVMRLDKVYPTDHCAFCPVWPQARACREHPLISVATHTCFVGLEAQADNGRATAVLEKNDLPVDGEECIFCGVCKQICPAGAVLDHPPDMPWDPASPPVAHIDRSRCDQCGKCLAACPTNAISFSRERRTVRVPVADCIFAGGFFEPHPGPAPEFGAHSHPDILTAMAFEAWSAEFRSAPGPTLLCPSDLRPAKRVAFIQCAGARDKRHLPYCAAVCCMHAAKQAAWIQRRQPELEVLLFYTDLRAPGKGQEGYMRRAMELGVRAVRRRPGLAAPAVTPQGAGIAVRHEQGDTVVTTLADMVILNGGLAACPLAGAPEKGDAHDRRCGFCREPADIAGSVIQAGAVASRVHKNVCAGDSLGTSTEREEA